MSESAHERRNRLQRERRAKQRKQPSLHNDPLQLFEQPSLRNDPLQLFGNGDASAQDMSEFAHEHYNAQVCYLNNVWFMFLVF
jgi:hypothetical protein